MPKPAKEESDSDDDGWGEMEPEAAGLEEFDYDNSDLNKCSDYELKKHKKKMDENFSKNQLKPGDKGFQYDKRVTFDKDDLEENSWDEDEEEEKPAPRTNKSKTALEIAMEKAMAAANLHDDDEDYFDDDFE